MSFLVDNPTLGVTLVAFFTSVIITAVQALSTDQNRLKSMRKELADLKKKAVEAQKANNTKDAQKHQKRMMEMSHEQMQMSMKPMLITLIAVAPIFFWMMPSLYGIDPVPATAETTIAYQTTEVQASYASETRTLEIGGRTVQGTQESGFFSGDSVKFEDAPVIEHEGHRFTPVSIKDGNLNVKLVAVTLPFAFPRWGADLGWLGWYVLCSLPFSVLTRKLLGVA